MTAVIEWQKFGIRGEIHRVRARFSTRAGRRRGPSHLTRTGIRIGAPRPGTRRARVQMLRAIDEGSHGTHGCVMLSPRAMGCKAPQHRWHSRHRWSFRICKLQISLKAGKFESHSLRQSATSCNETTYTDLLFVRFVCACNFLGFSTVSGDCHSR